MGPAHDTASQVVAAPGGRTIGQTGDIGRDGDAVRSKLDAFGPRRRFSLRVVRSIRRSPPRATACRDALWQRGFAAKRPATALRGPGLLCAQLRRPLLPDLGARQPEQGDLVQQFLPGKRDQAGLRQQYNRKSTPSELQSPMYLVCRLLLE